VLYNDISEFSSLLLEPDPAVVLDKAAETPDDDCPLCGMPRSEWKGNGGKGYRKDIVTYCCRGCAEGSGCTCAAGAARPEGRVFPAGAEAESASIEGP
jgi:hypothetical protein